jgi:multiubiquitin
MAEDPREREFTIFVNNQPFKTDKRELTGAQIKALAGVPADYELFEVQGDKTVSIGNNQEVHIHEGMHFRAIPSGTFGRRDVTT